MTTFDEAMFYGFLLGIGASTTVAVGLWAAREEGRSPRLPVPNDEPFRPLADLRIIRVCENCRRYLGESRTITEGQHLNLLHDLCPRCAKRRAVTADTLTTN